jgi:hypothetical protein
MLAAPISTMSFNAFNRNGWAWWHGTDWRWRRQS